MVLGKKMCGLRQNAQGLEEEGEKRGDMFGRRFKASFFVVYALTAKRGFVLQRLGELPMSGGGGGGGEEQETHHFI